MAGQDARMESGTGSFFMRGGTWRLPEWVRLAIPALILSLTFPWFGCKSTDESAAGTSDPHLAGEVAKIHFAWTNWMQQPELQYDPITTNQAVSLCGRWLGSFDNEGERQSLDLVLNTNGTWASEAWPDMTNGHWALAGGIILLFEKPLSEAPQAASALTLHNHKLRLLLADSDSGYVELHRL